MAEEKQNITCFDCGADIPKNEIEDGRCPKCKYDIQGHLDYLRRQDVLKRSDKPNDPPPAKKRRGIF